MAIVRPEQMDFSNKRFNLVLAGPPGVGKTTVAMSAPDPILFDLDNGVSRLKAEHRGITSSVDTYEQLLEDMQSPEYKNAQSVILDTGGSLIQLMQPWAKKQDPKAARDGRAMFGVIKREFDRLTHQIRAVDKKNCITIFHTTEQQKGDLITQRLSCEGSAKDIVWTPADLGCYMYMVGSKRMLGFSPTEEYFAKACFGIRGVRPVLELRPGDPNTFLTMLFEEARGNILKEMNAYAPQRKDYDAAMSAGRALIDKAADADALSIAAATIRDMPHALSSKAELSALISAKAKEMGLTYSKEAQGYVPVDRKSA